MSERVVPLAAEHGKRLGSMVRILAFVGAGGGVLCLGLIVLAFQHVTEQRREGQELVRADGLLHDAHREVTTEARALVARTELGESIEREELAFVDRVSEAIFECRSLGGTFSRAEELCALDDAATDLRTLLVDLRASGVRRSEDFATLSKRRRAVAHTLAELRRAVARAQDLARLDGLSAARAEERKASQPSGRTAQSWRKSLGRQGTYSLLSREVDGLNVWVERLYNLRDRDLVPDIRDNHLGTGIQQILGEIKHWHITGTEDATALAPIVHRLADLLFGADWSRKEEDQTVVLGRDGMLTALDRSLLAEYHVERLGGLIEAKLDELAVANESLGLAGLADGLEKARQEERTYVRLGLLLVVVLVLGTGTFLHIAWRVASGVHEQVEDLQRSNEAAAEAYRQVKQASRARDRFLANASHELRTPLNAVIGTAEVLASDPCERPEHRARIRDIRTASESLLWLIDGVLDFASLEAGEIQVELTDCDLAELVNELARRTGVRARRRGLVLSACILPGIPEVVRTDQPKVRRIVGELLENALKFTATGEVGIVLEARREEILVQVSDTGPGIPPEILERARSGFVQEDDSTHRETSGLGIGVAVITRLAEALDGELAFEALWKDGTGTVATFRLPVAAPIEVPVAEDRGPAGVGLGAQLSRQLCLRQLRGMGYAARDVAAGAIELPAEAPIVLDRGDERVAGLRERGAQGLVLVCEPGTARSEQGGAIDRPWQLSEFAKALEEGSARTAPAEPESALGEGLRVLLVDDNALNLRIAEKLLTRLGCEVATAVNGEIAVAACRASAFDLVVMDCQMPVMDGYEATEAIRTDGGASGADVAVVALTANALPGDRERCLRSGMNDYLAKPVRIDGLRKMIERWAGEPRLPA